MRKFRLWFIVITAMLLASITVLVIQQNTELKMKNEILRTAISDKDGRIFELEEVVRHQLEIEEFHLQEIDTLLSDVEYYYNMRGNR